MTALFRRWMQRCALAAYTVLVWCAQPLLLYKLKRRAQAEPMYGQWIAQRFGRYGAGVALCTEQAQPADLSVQHAGAWVWLHAVSLGETRAAAAVLVALRQQLPQIRLLLTHSTATGRQEGERLLRAGDCQVWLPWDTPGAVGRFLQHFQPQVGVLMETEVWPHLVAACQHHGVPLLLVNARLNARSLQRAQQWTLLAHPAYAGLHTVWAQTQEDALRLQQLGAPVRGVLGNVKFDLLPDVDQCQLGKQWRYGAHRPVFMLASSRDGEEALWLEQWLSQRLHDSQMARETGIQWLVVPRHPQRVDAVEQLLLQAGLSVSRRSQWRAAPAAGVDVWLGDSLGEMALYYSMSDVALLGGSFAPLGGQNLIEAAACGCPVVTGPHTFNFAQAVEQACAAGAAQQVPSMQAALGIALAWVADGQAHALARVAGLQFAASHRGAAQAYARGVVEVLAQRADATPLRG